MASWNFLTNHALVLMHIGSQPNATGFEIARAVGITERAARKIIGDLQASGYVEAERVGRRNEYRVDTLRPLGLQGERDSTVGALLGLLPHD